MANTLNTRISMRYDSFDAWKSANPKLMRGEIAVVAVPAVVAPAVNEVAEVVSPPAILFKVGDGDHSFNDLPYVNAPAADVHEWAKAAEKPVYLAEEIEGLEAYIDDVVAEDSNTKYKMEMSGDTLTLYSQEVGKTEWALCQSVNLAEATSIEAVINAVNENSAEWSAKVDTEAMNSAIGAAIDSLSITDYAKKTDLDDYAKKVDYVDNISFNDYVDSHENVHDELNGLIEVMDGNVAKLIGTDTDKSVRAISAEEVAKIVANAHENYDTLKEIADWIMSDPSGAAGMSEKINEVYAEVFGEDGVSGSGIDDKIENVQSQLSGIDGEVTTYVSDKIRDAIADKVTATQLGEVSDVADDAAASAEVANKGVATLNTELYGNGTAATPGEGSIVDKLNDLRTDFIGLNTAVTGVGGLEEVVGKHTDAINELHDIAKTGDAADLTQTAGDYLILNCGTAAATFSATPANLPS